MKKNIIFLDIDGVLNSPLTIDKIGPLKGINSQKIRLLKEITNYTDSDIVLVSSWKKYWTPELRYDGVRSWKGNTPKRYGRYLNIRLGRFGLEIADRTMEDHGTLRAIGILHWLEKHPDTENFIILDDQDFDYEYYMLDRHWVSTDWENKSHFLGEGLTPKKVEEVKRRFDAGEFRKE